MDQKITLYHGSEQIVEAPAFGLGKHNNDFGLGFYCTESEALAKEWAVSSLRNGFANRYSLDTEYLKILNLNSPDYTILNWIAVLVEHRLFSIKNPAAQRAKRYLIENFGVNVNAYDLIIGYRADDSYFDFAASFLNNGISVQQLASAMRLGKLGEQIVVKSKYAFSLLHYEGFSIAEREKYYVLRKARNDEADQLYSKMLEEATDGLYMLDIIVLSVLYLPIAYCFAVYSKYEILFLRMSFKEPQSKKVKLMHRIKVIRLCGRSYKRICKFLHEYIPKMYIKMSNSEFDSVINDFKHTTYES